MSTISLLIEDYHNGNLLLEDFLIQAEEIRKTLEQELDFLKAFKNEYSSEIYELSQDYKDGYKGFLFEVRNGATRYSFKANEDWQKIDNEKKMLENHLKTMLKAKINGAAWADIDENGEQIVLPEITYGKSTVIIKKA